MTQILEYLRDHNVTPPIFDNKLVKQITGSDFGNQFDLTKFPSSHLLPAALRERDCFPIHLGSGRHQIVGGIENGYHRFERIQDRKIIQWPYRRSALDGTDASEAGVLSIAFNQKILSHFIFGDRIANPRVHLPRRTKHSFSYRIADQEFKVTNLQIEQDLTIEEGTTIALFEAKNDDQDKMRDFAIYQLYHPYRHYLDMISDNRLRGIENIRSVYVKKTGNAIRLYEYRFSRNQEPTSIEMLHCAEYRLVEESGLDRY